MLFLFVKQLAFIVARSLKTAQEGVVTDAQSFFRAFPPTLPGIAPMLNPATSYSPRCSPMRWIRHWRRTWGNLTKYNVGRWLKNDLEEGPDGMHKEKAPDIV